MLLFFPTLMSFPFLAFFFWSRVKQRPYAIIYPLRIPHILIVAAVESDIVSIWYTFLWLCNASQCGRKLSGRFTHMSFVRSDLLPLIRKKRLYRADSLAISVRFSRRVWHPYERLNMARLFKKMIRCCGLIFWDFSYVWSLYSLSYIHFPSLLYSVFSHTQIPTYLKCFVFTNTTSWIL